MKRGGRHEFATLLSGPLRLVGAGPKSGQGFNDGGSDEVTRPPRLAARGPAFY